MSDIEKDFSAAFDKADEADLSTAAPAAAPASEPATAPAAPAPVQTDGTADPAPAAQEATPSPAPAPAPAVDWEHRFKSLQGLAAKQGQELKEWREKAQQAQAAAPAPVSAPAPAAEPDADDELLAQLDESAPSVSRAVKALVAKERKALEKQFQERLKSQEEAIVGKIRPLEERSAEAEVDNHFKTISAKHADWVDVVASPEMVAWVKTKPSYVQREFQRISEHGTAAEVVEILDEFKKEKAGGQAEPTPAPSPQQDARLRAAQVVESRPRPISTKGVREKGYDEAFEEASQTS